MKLAESLNCCNFADDTKVMRTRQDYIDILSRASITLRDEFGIKSLRLFGSVARDEQTENSDVDVCVDMSPKMFLIIRLKRYLEMLLGTSVDVVRLHKYMNPFLKEEIERDGIVVFK